MSDRIQIEPVIGWPAYCDEIMSSLSLAQLEVSNLKVEISDLQEEASEVAGQLREVLGWVRHWQADVAGNLKPTPDSLSMVEAKIIKALGGVA